MAARKLASIILYTSEYYSCENNKTGGLLCFYHVYSSTVMNLLQLCIVWYELSFWQFHQVLPWWNGGSIGSGQEREVVLPDKVNLALQSEQDPNWHSSPLKPWVQFSAYIWNLFSWVPTAPTVFRRQKQGQLHVHFGCLAYVRIWDMRMIFFSVLRVEPKAPCVGCVLYN